MKLMTAGQGAGDDPISFSGEPDSHLRIGEMAKLYSVTLRALRFYEDKGLLKPLREGSSRLYSRRDQSRLKLILLGRKVGFSLRDIKQVMDLYDPSGSNTKQFKLTLDKSAKQMQRLQSQRAAIEEAIGELGELMDDLSRRLNDRGSASTPQ